MRHKILLLIVLFIFFSSCKEDFYKWKKYNEYWLQHTNKNYIDSLQNAPVKDGYQMAGHTNSGIQYIIHHNGYGAIAKRSSLVKVTYQNYLIDGSKAGNAENAMLDMGELIAGWQEMLCDRGIRQGANITIYIPWNLAYGSKGNKIASLNKYFIPPYSTLISEIILHEVHNYPPKS